MKTLSAAALVFSHLGIYAADLAAMEGFYCRVLEFTVTDRGSLQTASGEARLTFMSRDPEEHHQIVLVSGRPEHVAFNVINQISFKVDSLSTLKEMYRRMETEGAPNMRCVTHGNSLSLYAPDPEGNRLEFYFDLPWYVSQPLSAVVDLAGSDDEIMANAEHYARGLPGFKTRAAWRAEMVERMSNN